MLPLDDTRWDGYIGGYQVLYDASVPLRKLLNEGPSQVLWDELWQELYHQGDIGSASFAAVPWLLEFVRRSPHLDWNAFGLSAVIELERPRYCRNREIPSELTEGYFTALDQLPEVAAQHPQRKWDANLTQHIMACIALSRGQPLLARVYLEMDRPGAIKWLADGMGFDARQIRQWAEE